MKAQQLARVFQHQMVQNHSHSMQRKLCQSACSTWRRAWVGLDARWTEYYKGVCICGPAGRNIQLRLFRLCGMGNSWFAIRLNWTVVSGLQCRTGRILQAQARHHPNPPLLKAIVLIISLIVHTYPKQPYIARYNSM